MNNLKSDQEIIIGKGTNRLSENQIYQEVLHRRAKRKLNRILEAVFEFGYYDIAPKWYWMAVEKTLQKADEIAKYIPEQELYDDLINAYDLVDLYEDRIELTDILDDVTIISRCWKLLDRFYDKIEDRNLFYVRLGLLDTFIKIFNEFEKEYL